jgi:uncharacterized protein (TIGR02300 family)
VAKPDLGNKHQCQHCGTKFFDLNKDPIVCPKCGTVQQNIGAAKVAAVRPAPVDEDVEIDPAAPVLVPIEEADVIDEKGAVVADDEIEIEDDASEETFLEEEEEDEDDVSGLIDGEIEDDEEA